MRHHHLSKPVRWRGRVRIAPRFKASPVCDGIPCPRCGRPTEIRTHATITEKQLRQPFYYRRWYVCVEPGCPTRQIMRDVDRIFIVDDAEGAADQQLSMIMEQLRPRQ